jgi:hypothetical protein
MSLAIGNQGDSLGDRYGNQPLFNPETQTIGD